MQDCDIKHKEVNVRVYYGNMSLIHGNSNVDRDDLDNYLYSVIFRQLA